MEEDDRSDSVGFQKFIYSMIMLDFRAQRCVYATMTAQIYIFFFLNMNIYIHMTHFFSPRRVGGMRRRIGIWYFIITAYVCVSI